MIGRLAPPKEIEINLQGSFPHVPVNEMALQQVFQNLLTNAIKYNDKPKGIINILAKKDNRFHHFYFSDNGAGIAEEQLETIFQKPSTYHATGGYQNKGTGIGLAQVKRIIESAGGNISVASKVNEGTDFRISLPQYN